MPIALNCANCGKSIKRFQSQIRENNFCSRSCFVDYKNKTGFYLKENNPKWNGGPVEKTCEACGKIFTVRRSQAEHGRGRYCSNDCRRNASLVLKICEICGAEFRLKKSHDINGNGRYCSLECRSIGYKQREIFKGKNNPRYIHGKSYTPEYIRRAKHLRRTRIAENGGTYTLDEWTELCASYGNKCLCCGTVTEQLAVDHVIPIIKGGSSDISNLQPLCLSCNSSKSSKVIDYR